MSFVNMACSNEEIKMIQFSRIIIDLHMTFTHLCEEGS